MIQRRRIERLCLGLIIACFAYGFATHAWDFLRLGWWPYRHGPTPVTIFWNSLVLLDAMVALLLVLGRRRAGLLLALLVMIADVAVNSYATLVLGSAAFGTAVVLQAILLGFLLGSIGFLWPSATAPAWGSDRESRS